jgi:hypothetical protein
MSTIRNLPKITILVIIAAVAIIAVFLPWLTFTGDSSSGWDMIGDAGLGSSSILLIPLASLVIFGLVYLYKTTVENRWLYCLIASAVTLIPVLWFFFWKQKSFYKPLDYGIGFWINLLAAIAMVALCGYTVYKARSK